MAEHNTFFSHVHKDLQKEFGPEAAQQELTNAWPSSDWGTKGIKGRLLREYFNLYPSARTHDSLNGIWSSAKRNAFALMQEEVLNIPLHQCSVWYANWLWTVLKQSKVLKIINVPYTMNIQATIISSFLQKIPGHIAIKVSYLQGPICTAIASLNQRKVIIRLVQPLQEQFIPNPAKNEVVIETVQLNEDLTLFRNVIAKYPQTKPNITLPGYLINKTSVLHQFCKDIATFADYDVMLEHNNALQIAQSYPSVRKPITVQSICDYFDTAHSQSVNFKVLYPKITENEILLEVSNIDAALTLKKHLIVEDKSDSSILPESALSTEVIPQGAIITISCLPGKIYSIKYQLEEPYEPSAEILIATLHCKSPNQPRPAMNSLGCRQQFLERAKQLDPDGVTPFCYLCKAPIVGNEFDLDHILPWAKFQRHDEDNILPAHAHCNRSKSDHFFTMVLQPSKFQFPLVTRVMSIEGLDPAVVHYLKVAKTMLESRYDCVKVNLVLKMEHLESNLQDKNWQQITDDMLRDLLTTYEYDVIDRSQLPSAANDANKYFTASYCGQQVFIKKIEVTPSNSKYAMRELIWLKVLKFPTIVQFLGFYYQGTDKLHLVFEHLKCDLASKLAELTPANRLCIAKQICSAVVYLHSRDVIHRDLKLKNVLLDDQNNAKLCDLGISRKIESQMTLSPVGTVGYMAPEVLDKTLVAYSKQSDVYSFGILLLELASGRSAWEGKTEQHIEQMILKGYIPQSLASFTGTLIHQLVFSCLTKDPNNRPSFPEILEKLQQDSIADPFV